MFSCFRGNNDVDAAVMINGAMLLEKSIALNNGRGKHPIRYFSSKDLQNATNVYCKNNMLYDKGYIQLYKGFLKERPLIIGKFRYTSSEIYRERAINDLVFASEMSGHKNFLKLLGCCVEFKVPVPVYEYTREIRSLKFYLGNTEMVDSMYLSWKHRLKIAIDVSNAIAYLHTAFSRPIIHGSIHPSNILIDEYYVAKLHGFSLSVVIPEGETQITENRIEGRFDYMAPEYAMSGVKNEKIDVFSFGIVLVELLTGKLVSNIPNSVTETIDNRGEVIKKYIEEQRLDKIMDPIIVQEGMWRDREQHFKAFLILARQCIRKDREKRPESTSVVKQLRHLYHSHYS